MNPRVTSCYTILSMLPHPHLSHSTSHKNTHALTLHVQPRLKFGKQALVGHWSQRLYPQQESRGERTFYHLLTRWNNSVGIWVRSRCFLIWTIFYVVIHPQSPIYLNLFGHRLVRICGCLCVCMKKNKTKTCPMCCQGLQYIRKAPWAGLICAVWLTDRSLNESSNIVPSICNQSQ